MCATCTARRCAASAPTRRRRRFARIEEAFTERERDVARRARNAHQTPPKNADAAEYHRATALEAVIGYLFVTGQRERMEEILKLALEDDHEKR